VGRTVLVGLTILDREEQPVHRTEVHGVISSTAPGEILELERADGGGVFRFRSRLNR
jgi:hypothetical protein